MSTETTTPSGITLVDTVVGTGAECTSGATVHVHYTGMLTSGTIFDSNWDDPSPIKFPLRDLIKGWQEGIPGMKVGGTRRLTIPYQLAYGERGIPGTIPPKSTLVFDIKLVGLG